VLPTSGGDMKRGSSSIATFVELADKLVDDYDVIDVLTALSHGCVDTVDVDAAAVMLASPVGELRFITSSSESMRDLELFQIHSNEGPCVDCIRNGLAIVNTSLSASEGRWPMADVCASGDRPRVWFGSLSADAYSWSHDWRAKPLSRQ
jgi:hypothetical protein